MGRTYKRQLGTRRYGNFSQEQIESAVSDVANGVRSLRDAARTYGVSYGTLHNRFHGRRIKKTGGQTVLSVTEEQSILKNILKCADWGFPLTQQDLKMFVKSYLDNTGRIIHRFKDNLPGPDWTSSFLKRHRNDAGKRLASNISAKRSQVTPTVIRDYFNNLRESVEGVPPENFFNYDESNLSDDPGKKLCIYRRGTKYPEKVCNHSKSATSIMICGSASGTLLPPYVIYKAENLWDTWTTNGPKGYPCCNMICCSGGTRYNRTSHGWIDMPTFNEWFSTVFLPHAKRLEGRKVLLGDNLSSHFNPDVLRQCEKHNILFVCLPPNCTHMCQPLDVAFFRPFKESWRKTLTAWKMRNTKISGIPKNEFPLLLKQCLDNMDKVLPKDASKEKSAVKRNLISGFESCGLVPFNPDRVLRKLPGDNSAAETVEREVADSLTEYLKNQRYVTKTILQRKKMLRVEPGKSVAAPAAEDSSSEEDESAAMELEDDSDVQDDISSDEGEPLEYTQPTLDNIVIDNFVLVKFLAGSRKKTEFRFVCRIKNVLEDSEFEVIGLKSAGSRRMFKLVEDDVSVVPLKDIVALLPNPRCEKISDRIVKYHFQSDVNSKEC